MSKNPNQSFRSLLQAFQEDLGLLEKTVSLGPEHVLREDSHLDGGSHSLRARTGKDTFYVYTWKPNVSVQTIGMSREEALKLAALINKTYPLEALGGL